MNSEKTSSHEGVNWVILLALAGVIATVNVVIPADRFYDYPSYLIIIDQLHYFPIETLLSYEVTSNLFFMGLRSIIENSEKAVNVAHFLLGICFLSLCTAIARIEKVGWRSILLFFALYGPLLAFVTIRATPAYFLIAWSALRASRGQLSALPLALAALTFHVTVAIAFIPIAVVLLQNRYASFSWIGRTTGLLFAGAALYAGIFVFFPDFVSSVIVTTIDSIPFLAKYSRYTYVIDSASGGRVEETYNLTLHYAYSGAAAAFAATCLLLKDERLVALRGYMIVSMFIFAMMQFSPISAYRQSLYWMMPAIFAFPMERYVRPGAMTIVYIIVCAGIFVATFPTVYE